MAIDEGKILDILHRQRRNEAPAPYPGLTVAERLELWSRHLTDGSLELFEAAKQRKEETGREDPTLKMAIHVKMAVETALGMLKERLMEADDDVVE